MNNMAQRNCILYVTGFSEDTDRGTLKNEFSKFGRVEKLFVESSGKFAKVFYNNKGSCDIAIQELNKTALQWNVQYFNSLKHTTEKNLYKSSSTISSEASNMASYREHYEDDDEDFSENFDYCNVHGQPLTVLQADTGDLYVNLKDIRKTGFALFRRDTFDSMPIDKRQIGKEFELHLLSESKNYILKNKVAVIQEEDILKTIERCKNKLLGETSHESRNNFGPGRSVVPTRNNFVITASSSISSPSIANLPTGGHLQSPRPPKTLPNNYMPFNRNEDKSRSKSQDRGPRNNQFNTNRYNESTKQATNFNNTNNRQRQFVNGFETPVQQKKKPAEHNDSKFAESQSDLKRSKSIVERNKEEKKAYAKEDIGKLALDVGSTYEVQIVFIEDKENICWVQKKNDGEAIEDLLLQLNETEEDLETVEPVVGQLVIAQFEGAWSRGRVTGLNPLTVHFLDYGNKSEVEIVKPLLDKFKKIPALAARIKINKTHDLSRDMVELTIKIKQQYDDGTYLANLVNSGSSSSENENSFTKPSEVKKTDEVPVVTEKYYLEIPKPMAKLKDGDKVMIIETEGTKFLVRTKECAQKCKEITEYIKNLDKSFLTLNIVKVGQLVLGSKDGLVGLYRAIILKKDNAFVTLKYVDFPGEDDLSIKSIRNVDSFLAQEASCILLTPDHQGLKDIDEKVSEYIAEICQNKEKFTVILSDGGFDLQLDNGTLLSEKLSELRYPKKAEQVKPTKQPVEEETVPQQRKSANKIFYDDMDWITVTPGSHSFLCYRFNGIDDVTMIDSREEVISYVEQITGLEVTDTVPYMPEELEMCLVLYSSPDDEASWCRATVLSVEDDACDVSFVDFGNKEKVNIKDIRKFPADLKNVPMLGINCELVGLPNTPEILKCLEEFLPEGDQVDVNVKGLSGSAHHKYQIEIPTIYKLLQAEGLY